MCHSYTHNYTCNSTHKQCVNQKLRQRLSRSGRVQPVGRQSQQGSMLVIAIFIIIVIAVLAASLSKILSSSANSVATEVYSSKAYYAAESGMESAIYRVLRIKPLDCKRFPAEKGLNFDVSGIEGLENCEVNMTCQEIVIDANNSQFYLTSTATCGTNNMVSQHRVEAEIK